MNFAIVSSIDKYLFKSTYEFQENNVCAHVCMRHWLILKRLQITSQ